MITACICFRNEGDEVENTIKSILSTTSHTKIMLVDDCSDDSTDYLAVANKYNCEYYRMSERCGSVGTKDFAGRNCQTEYFVLLDGHMRFYEQDWDMKLIKLLDKYPRSIISSRTSYISRDTQGNLQGDKECVMRSYCAYMRFSDGYDFDPRWTDKVANYNDADKTSDVSCVLGACYATTKSWWREIDGLHGLNTYGLEESFMSIKTWLLGGSCKVTHDFAAGHLYRDINPNRINSAEIDSNRLLLAYLFDINTAQLSAQLYKRLGLFLYGEALETFSNRLEEYKKIKAYLKSKQVRPFDFILDLNKKLIQ